MSARRSEGEYAGVRTVGKGPQRVVASSVSASLVLVRGQTGRGRGGTANRRRGVADQWWRGAVRAYAGTVGAGAVGSGKRRGESKPIDLDFWYIYS